VEYQFLLSKDVCVKGHGMLTGSWQFDECKLEYTGKGRKW